MPWRLIFFAVFVVLLVVFVGFNLNNSCAVSLIFVTYQDVPIYISILLAFAIGMLIMIPFTFGKKSGNQEQGRPVKTRRANGRRAAARNADVPKATPVAEEDQPVARPLNED